MRNGSYNAFGALDMKPNTVFIALSRASLCAQQRGASRGRPIRSLTTAGGAACRWNKVREQMCRAETAAGFWACFDELGCADWGPEDKNALVQKREGRVPGLGRSTVDVREVGWSGAFKTIVRKKHTVNRQTDDPYMEGGSAR